METKLSTSKEIITYLAEKFPACFSLEGPVKPLKVGIFQDLAEKLVEDEKVSKTRLRQALRHYTSSWRYLKSLKVGSFRIDLAGENVAEIDQEQADYASKTLKESQEKFGNKNPKAKLAKKSNNEAKVAEKSTKDKKKQFKNVKSTKNVSKPAQPKVELKPVESSAICIGAKVKVKFGNSPMEATITEVTGRDVQVQLLSGMVIKTQIDNIFI
jgi:ProP effector